MIVFLRITSFSIVIEEEEQGRDEEQGREEWSTEKGRRRISRERR
jgi:hypothetical protein